MRAALLCLALVAAPGCSSDGNGNGDDPVEQSVVRACIRSTACSVKAYPRVSDCVSVYLGKEMKDGLDPVVSSAYRCTNRATTCREVESCHGAQGSCTSSYGASCASGRALTCDLIDDRIYATDCAAEGLACVVDAANPWYASCTGPPTQPSLSTELRCGDIPCTDTGESCTSGAMNRCEGEALLACLEGRWIRFDCAELGLGPCRSEGSGDLAWARCGVFPL